MLGGCGYITTPDFNSLSWDTLILLGGGLSLGVCVDSSGLLVVVGEVMENMLEGASAYVVILAFTGLVGVLANFISSTVAAVLLMPVVVHVGVAIGQPELLVMLCAFMTSGAMGLPVSSFPNANSFAVRDKYGKFPSKTCNTTIYIYINNLRIFIDRSRAWIKLIKFEVI